MSKKETKGNTEDSVIVRNKKASHDYHILETMEAGIVLCGTEVKSCREHSVSLQDAYAKIENNQLFLYGMHIAAYSFGNRFNHESVRPRKLLMHKKEILKLASKINEKGLALVPLKLYLKRGKVKVDLGIGKGKTFEDKRDTLRKRQDTMDARRAVAER